jgi:hypothetical protein
MSTTTIFGQVGTDQPSTHNKRNAVIVFTVIALFALSFFLGRATATSHVGSAQVATHAQLSPADRAIVANDTARVTPQLSPADRGVVAADVAPAGGTLSNEKMSAANRAEIANDVAPVSDSGTSQLSAANRAQIANDVAPVAPLSQANSASCVAGRPC